MTAPADRKTRPAKAAIDALSVLLVSPWVLACRTEAAVRPHQETVFTLCAQTFALIPGVPGLFLRRAFYRGTLHSCSRHVFIGFGALFTHRAVTVASDVYVGPYALVGSARLGAGALIGSRASIISGTALHELDADGRWTPSDLSRLRQIDVGDNAWVGEAAVVMADVGAGSMVAAGSVVATPVPPGLMVAGNPARFVRKLQPPPGSADTPSQQPPEESHEAGVLTVR